MIMMMIKTMAMMVTMLTMVMMVMVVTIVTIVMVMTIVTVVTTWKKSLPKCPPPHKYTLLHHLRSLRGNFFHQFPGMGLFINDVIT